MSKKREELIRLKNVSKFYYMGDSVVKALDGINFKVYTGEFVAIMGTSGSGKTTAMNMVGSLDVPTKGQVFFRRTRYIHIKREHIITNSRKKK